METLDRLLTLGRTLSQGKLDIDLEIATIDEYVALFAEWQKGAPLDSIAEHDRPRLEELASLHANIVGRAVELKSLVAGEMRKLRSKAKGIIAYTDTLPRSLSLGRTIKG